MGDDKRALKQAGGNHAQVLPKRSMDDFRPERPALVDFVAKGFADLSKILIQRPSLTIPGSQVNLDHQQASTISFWSSSTYSAAILFPEGGEPRSFVRNAGRASANSLSVFSRSSEISIP